MMPIYRSSWFGEVDPILVDYQTQIDEWKSKIKNVRRREIAGKIKFDTAFNRFYFSLSNLVIKRNELAREFNVFYGLKPAATYKGEAYLFFPKNDFPGSGDEQGPMFQESSIGYWTIAVQHLKANIDSPNFKSKQEFFDNYFGKGFDASSLETAKRIINKARTLDIGDFYYQKYKDWAVEFGNPDMLFRPDNRDLVLQKIAEVENLFKPYRLAFLDEFENVLKIYSEYCTASSDLDFVRKSYDQWKANYDTLENVVGKIPSFDELVAEADKPDIVVTEQAQELPVIEQKPAIVEEKKSNVGLYAGAAALALLFLKK